MPPPLFRTIISSLTRSSWWTPLVFKKCLLLSLLSIQIGCQPLLMGWYAKDATNVNLRVGIIEAMKLVMAFLPLLCSRQLLHQIKQWNLHHALQTTAAPALIYVLQNYLNQTAVVVLDGVTFNILNQTKIIWAALLVYMMLHKYQSRMQIVALTLLCAAAVLMTTRSNSSSIKLEDTKENDAVFFTGVYQALIAAILSALAGTIIQRALQTQKRNAYIVTMELSLLGELTLLLWAWTSSSGVVTSPWSSTMIRDTLVHDDEPNMWTGWTGMTFLTLMLQAGGGVIVGFVIKYCGNVEKSFAVVVGMILTAWLEYVYNDKPFGVRGMVAIAMVAMSTIMYTMFPPLETPETSSKDERRLRKRRNKQSSYKHRKQSDQFGVATNVERNKVIRQMLSPSSTPWEMRKQNSHEEKVIV